MSWRGGGRDFINAIACNPYVAEKIVLPVLSFQTLSIIFTLVAIITAIFYLIKLLAEGRKKAQYKTRQFVTYTLIIFFYGGLMNSALIQFEEYIIVPILYLISWISTIVIYLITNKIRRHKSGGLLLDLGTSVENVWMWNSITIGVAGVLTLWVFLTYGIEFLKGSGLIAIVIFWCCIILSCSLRRYHNQLKEHAICYQGSVIQWQQVRSYRWSPYRSNFLNISFEPDTFFFLSDSVEIKIPPHCREQVLNIVKERVPND